MWSAARGPAVLVLAGLAMLAAGSAPDGPGRTPDTAAESSSRWVPRYSGPGGGDHPRLRLAATAGGGMSVFVRERRRAGWSLLRWDGASWRRDPLPAQFRGADRLEVGSSPSGETVWAVVTITREDDATEHLWRLSGGRWSKHLSQDATWTGVIDVEVGPRDDAWFVTRMDPDGERSAVLHWDGRAWSHNAPDEFDLTSAAAGGPDDVWVVAPRLGDRTFHWNGAGWREVRHPCAGEQAGPPCRGRPGLEQSRQAAQADGQAWLVGPPWPDGGSPVVLHWDRTRWRQVGLSATRTGLTAVRADPVGGVWIAANPESGAPYVLNLRHGRWTRSTLRAAGPGERIVDVVPAAGTTRLWVQTERPGRGRAGTTATSSVYELA
ncbi:hypothetical protein AB0L05_30415 [Nonomuraea pusilla]